jgi:hypothetical protein
VKTLERALEYAKSIPTATDIYLRHSDGRFIVVYPTHDFYKSSARLTLKAKIRYEQQVEIL